MEELDVTVAKEKATYEEIKAYVLKHSGLICRLDTERRSREVSDKLLQWISPLKLMGVKQRQGVKYLPLFRL